MKRQGWVMSTGRHGAKVRHNIQLMGDERGRDGCLTVEQVEGVWLGDG